jgi:hypothetical protein
MAEYRFEREARTPYSEAYTIDDGEHSLGRVDMHFTSSATHATLIVHQSLDEQSILALVEELDARIVASADPYREDLIVTVWRGEEFGVYADDSPRAGDEDDGDDFDDEDDED